MIALQNPDLKVCEFNATRDTQFAHPGKEFRRVLHVFNDAWHGIRAACGYCPGNKMAISERTGIDGEMMRHVFGLIHRHQIDKIVFQGLSDAAARLIAHTKDEFGDNVDIYCVTHVTSTQFENLFEIEMQARALDLLRGGYLARLGSVKPGFTSIIPEYYPRTIINYAPNLPQSSRFTTCMPRSVFLPIENTWRKNFYTNMIAAAGSRKVDTVYAVNYPTDLQKIIDISKISLLPYRKGFDLLSHLATAAVVMNVTLAECQPMTQLEAFAVGTPCLTGELKIDEFADDPLINLCEVRHVDTPTEIREKLEVLLDMQETDMTGLRALIHDHLQRRTELASRRYRDFLGI